MPVSALRFYQAKTGNGLYCGQSDMTRPEPFRIAIPDERLSEIRTRVGRFDWDGFPDAGGWSAGIAKAEMRRIAAYWTGGYDWRIHEARLNELPQFRADVEGVAIHFAWVRGSGGAHRPPLLLLHGWPSSFVEFEQAAWRLARPEQFGAGAADGFDVVIASLPGYGFSDRPAAPIGPRAISRMLDTLMTRHLGYPQYITQGSDWGSIIAAWMGHDFGPRCMALHIKLSTIQTGAATPVTQEEMDHVALIRGRGDTETGYSHLQSTRPQTLGYGLHDSPVGTAAWILEKFAAWSDLPRKAGVPDLEAVYSLDQLLTNVMVYLVGGSMVTSTWIYQGATIEKSRLLERRVQVPTAVAAFADPVFPPPPRSLAEQSVNVVRWTKMPRGGHFPALEQPELFASDVRAFALTLAGNA